MRLAHFAAAAAVLASSASHAELIKSRSFQLSATVPVVCRVSHADVAVQGAGDVIELGQVERLCNDRAGFRLILIHDPELAGSTFSMGGVETQINGGMETVIYRSMRPQLRSESATLRLAPGHAMPTMLSFRIEAANSI